MRILAKRYILITFSGAAILACFCAMALVWALEAKTISRLEAAFVKGDLGWVEIAADGRQVVLSGQAETAGQRFQALALARKTVAIHNLSDQITVSETGAKTPAALTLQIFKTPKLIRAMGNVPSGPTQETLLAGLRDMAAGQVELKHFFTAAQRRPSETWLTAQQLGFEALAQIHRGEVTIAEDRVVVKALAKTEERRQELLTNLEQLSPAGLLYEVAVVAPNAAPEGYRFRAVKREGALRVLACRVDSQMHLKALASALQAFDVTHGLPCLMNLADRPSGFDETIFLALDAVKPIRTATIHLADNRLQLFFPDLPEVDSIAAVVEKIKQRLPEGYGVEASRNQPGMADGLLAAEFLFELEADGNLILQGPLEDQRAQRAVKALAQARFGFDKVAFSGSLVPALGNDWTLQILSLIEAMLPLQRAQMRLTRQDLAVSGLSHRKDAQAALALSVRQILPNTVRTDLQITYQPPPKREPDLLPAALCISQINGLLQSEKINFDPGSDRVNLAGQNLLDKIADILRQCGEIPLEIAGHTDSQGREEMNLQLSQTRAQAVLMELQRRRILTGSFVAQGYGETKPIAANDSAEGRDINRRIEFYLRENEPVRPVQGDPETLPAEARINANAGQ